MKRRHLQITKINYIGKEANEIEENEILPSISGFYTMYEPLIEQEDVD
jgi:hypothetical protein